MMPNDDDAPQTPAQRMLLRAVTQARAITERYERRPLDWTRLSNVPVPQRTWAVNEWLGMGHITLLAGRGGIGKSMLAQQLGSALALGQDLIGKTPTARRVLMWAGEDEPDELHRRQVDIAASMSTSVESFAGCFIVESFADRDCALAEMVSGELVLTPMLDELKEQAADYHADVIILDNIARLYGGNENDRHQVTKFTAALAGATKGAAVLLLGHVARSTGSEFSGSSAWENSVRSRLWFSDTLPDQVKDPDSAEQPDSDLRYLSRRKANYSGRDLRTLHFGKGCFAVEPYGETSAPSFIESLRRRKAEIVVVDGLRTLLGLKFCASDMAHSPTFLPRLLLEHKLAQGCTKHELATAMRQAITDGTILRGVVVGQYANRTAKLGLGLP